MTRAFFQLFGFSRDVRRVLLVNALVGLVSLGVNAVLLNLYLLRLGYGTQEIGMINALGPLCYALASLLAGALGGGYLVAGLGYSSLFTLGAGLSAASALLFFAYTQTRRR